MEVEDASLDGFLSGKPLPAEAAIVRDYRDQFALARRVNRECHRLIFGADVRNRDGQAMSIAGLFLRSLQHYQAVVLVLEKGLVASGKVSVRAELEAVFALRMVAASEENFRAFVHDDLIRRRRLMENAKKYDYPILATLREVISDEDIEEIKQRIISVGATELSTRKMSEEAGLHDLYVGVYPLLSRAAHSNVGELDAYLIQGADSEVREIDYAPSRDEIPSLLLTAADFILLGADAVAGRFEVDFGTMRTELSAAIKAGLDE
ncbi:MAG: hypothetical protein EOS22_04680 [Mesorhizobium sp.]|uniref:DUF5677 domain-containing protein n=1 Tax=Mesorhizobium sp. TaxID=1871066 RepID=UPI000FE51B89|nr:DUF5677 domain-containing protein [Mesorhizobium sp.]RWD31322.1 MAG: hypothetical protein EOS22_04680 [Mesorhizobium sp.]TJW70764.1 MAG: DUF3684 domain-containing protein [Mesorhizobium sp.]